MKPFDPEMYPPAEVVEPSGASREALSDDISLENEDVVDELGAAAGVTYKEDELLTCGAKEQERDRHRWELDPASAEDYRERMRHEQEPDLPAEPLLHMTHRGGRPRRQE